MESQNTVIHTINRKTINDKQRKERVNTKIKKK